jgi:hypothetical protein
MSSTTLFNGSPFGPDLKPGRARIQPRAFTPIPAAPSHSAPNSISNPAQIPTSAHRVILWDCPGCGAPVSVACATEISPGRCVACEQGFTVTVGIVLDQDAGRNQPKGRSFASKIPSTPGTSLAPIGDPPPAPWVHAPAGGAGGVFPRADCVRLPVTVQEIGPPEPSKGPTERLQRAGNLQPAEIVTLIERSAPIDPPAAERRIRSGNHIKAGRWNKDSGNVKAILITTAAVIAVALGFSLLVKFSLGSLPQAFPKPIAPAEASQALEESPHTP